MKSDINSLPSRRGVVASEIQERIKRRSRVCIQKCFPQPRLADFADGRLLPLVAGITETQLPVPSLKIIAKFSHFAARANIEQIIVVSELLMSGTGVVNGAKSNSGCYWETASIGKKVWNSRIGDREGVKRVLNWHAEGARTKIYIGAWDLEWVGNNRRRCVGRIEK